MSCELQFTHTQGPPAVTKLRCVGKCDPVYRKVEKKQAKGPPKIEAEEVSRTCKLITRVSFNEKDKKFTIGSTYCACVIDSASCKYSAEANPTDGSKLINAQCVGDCEELFQDKEFKEKITQTCGMILEGDTIKCVCYSI